jgi:hypothetical protein
MLIGVKIAHEKHNKNTWIYFYNSTTAASDGEWQ